MPRLTFDRFLDQPVCAQNSDYADGEKAPLRLDFRRCMGTKSARRRAQSAWPVPCLLINQKDAVIDSTRHRRISGTARAHAPAERTHAAHRSAQMAALTDGLMDAAAKYRVEQLRPGALQWPDWLTRQRGKLHAGLSVIETQLATHPWLANDAYSVADIGLMCVLNFIDFRQPDYAWRNRFSTHGAMGSTLGEPNGICRELTALKQYTHFMGISKYVLVV